MIKKLILNLGFVKQATQLASMEGTRFGIEQAHQNIQANVERLYKEKIASLLGVVNEDIIVTQNKVKGLVFIGGKLADEPRILSLQAEANYYFQSDMWKIINETIKEQAQKVMFEKSETLQDLYNGKAWLYLLDLQNTILNIFKDYKSKPKTPIAPKV